MTQTDTTVEAAASRVRSARLSLLPSAALSLEAQYPHEVRRWILYFGGPLLGACICIGLAFATPYMWLFGGAILLGPFVSVGAIVYLALSSDTNGGAASLATARSPRAATVPAVAPAS